ncbi:hypothetical protein AVEN_137233-1 [Araneus ventricosus]|uniref:Uncharacterized protein n=1 Tax=Araneus ventricosus TaxID=182803 RepID=A0A4Y2IUY0_ARAVE|nr:hypothetical protein AVEN_137233-1 [Araneus ventricosus]
MADSPHPPQLSSQSKDSVPFTASSTHACLLLHHWSSHLPLLLTRHGLEIAFAGRRALTVNGIDGQLCQRLLYLESRSSSLEEVVT